MSKTTTIFKEFRKAGTAPSLEEAQKFVGGWVETVPFPDGSLLIINEEGKLENLPLNPLATALWHKHYGPTDQIVGNAIHIAADARGEGWS